MRALLPERIEPYGRVSSSVNSQSAMSCCWSSSCVGFAGPMVPEGGGGRCPFSSMPFRAAAVLVVVWVGGLDPAWFVLLGGLLVLRVDDVSIAAFAI
jgi:hypothetical protein